MRVDERVEIARRLRIARGRRTVIAPRVRVNAHALLVCLIEDRREIHRAADAGTRRAGIGEADARVLNDELRAGSDGVAVVVHDRRAAIAGRRRGGMRAVSLIVVRHRIGRILAVRHAGKLRARIKKVVRDHLPPRGIDVRPSEAARRRPRVHRRRAPVSLGEEAVVVIETSVEDGDDLPFTVDAVVEKRRSRAGPAALQ